MAGQLRGSIWARSRDRLPKLYGSTVLIAVQIKRTRSVISLRLSTQLTGWGAKNKSESSEIHASHFTREALAAASKALIASSMVGPRIRFCLVHGMGLSQVTTSHGMKLGSNRGPFGASNVSASSFVRAHYLDRRILWTGWKGI